MCGAVICMVKASDVAQQASVCKTIRMANA